MAKTGVNKQAVHHRRGGLEERPAPIATALAVHHRIGGLEE